MIEALVTAGEGPQVETNPNSRDSRRETLNFQDDRCFRHWKGSTVVFGVDRDELTVVGLGSEDPKKLRDQLSSMIRSRVIPTPISSQVFTSWKVRRSLYCEWTQSKSALWNYC